MVLCTPYAQYVPFKTSRSMGQPFWVRCAITCILWSSSTDPVQLHFCTTSSTTHKLSNGKIKVIVVIPLSKSTMLLHTVHTVMNYSTLGSSPINLFTGIPLANKGLYLIPVRTSAYEQGTYKWNYMVLQKT